MTDGEHTKFRLNLPQFSIELAGEKKFVEELYQKVYRDLLPLLTQPTPKAIPQPPKQRAESRLDYTWIYNCTPHYNKVYVVENGVLTHSVFGRFLDPKRIRRVYIDRTGSSVLFKELSAGNRTLWAEITPEGRRMIEQAAKKQAADGEEKDPGKG